MGNFLRSFIRFCGIALMVLGPAMILTCIVSVISGEISEGLVFLRMGIVIGLIGYFSRRFCKSRKTRLSIGDGFAIVLLLWIVLSIVGALPYIICDVTDDPVSAFFESCSGFTTTGATVLTHINRLSHGILFWRSMTCWIGGITILLLGITLMPALGLNAQRLNTPEIHGPVLEQVTPRMMDSLRTIILIYTSLTLAETILLTASGMTLFNGLIHSMSTISTGGFSRYDDGMAHFEGISIPLITTVFMILSGLNYHIYLRKTKDRFRLLLRDSELRLYAVLLGSATLLICLFLIVQNDAAFGESIVSALFQSASFLSTTGFYSCDYSGWPQFPLMMMLLLMICGSCTASVGGGLKVMRVGILLKLVRHGISTRLHANFFETVKMNGKGLQTEVVSGVATMPFLFLTSLFVGAFLLTAGGTSISTAFNATIACLCNCGHAFGELGPMSTFASFGPLSKSLLCLIMIGGRMELYAIVILLTPKYWSQGH